MTFTKLRWNRENYNIERIVVQSRRAEEHASTRPKSATRRMESSQPVTKPPVNESERKDLSEIYN